MGKGRERLVWVSWLLSLRVYGFEVSGVVGSRKARDMILDVEIEREGIHT